MSKSALEIAQEFAQYAISKNPAIILGSGASAAYGIPGMPGLRDRLLKVGPPANATPDDVSSWSEFITVLQGTDLETALNKIHLSEAITAHVVESTWDFLAPYDLKVFEELLSKRDLFPLTKLYQHLFQSTRVVVSVITPNYDRLAEYAAEAANISHYTGFSFGNLRNRATDGAYKVVSGKSQVRTVNIWKVHGSFDWFSDADGVVVGLPLSGVRPTGLVPVIVTPGVEKYRRTHDEPFHSIKTEADRALHSADAYLCIGYGFNDSHLQTTLVERCRDKEAPLILLARTISQSALAFITCGKCGKYLAIEKSGKGCKVYCPEFPEGEEIPDKPLWQLSEFLTLVMA